MPTEIYLSKRYDFFSKIIPIIILAIKDPCNELKSLIRMQCAQTKEKSERMGIEIVIQQTALNIMCRGIGMLKSNA